MAHHGGGYQAVYAYPRESLDMWAERLDRRGRCDHRDLPP
ncbi:MOSC domain-containing protein [Ruania halotolerans]